MPKSATDGILEVLSAHFDPDMIKTFSGSPGIEGYPFVVVNGPIWGNPSYNTKRVQYERPETYQVTAAALDPKEAESIGMEAEAVLSPTSNGTTDRVTLDDGYEVNRLPGAGRTYNQPRAGPNELTVYYYQFDITFYVGRVQA